MCVFCRIKEGVCRNDFRGGFGPIFACCYGGPEKCFKLAWNFEDYKCLQATKKRLWCFDLEFNFQKLYDKRQTRFTSAGIRTDIVF